MYMYAYKVTWLYTFWVTTVNFLGDSMQFINTVFWIACILKIKQKKINISNYIVLYGGWVCGISRDLHCDQPAPRHNTPMNVNPCDPAMRSMKSSKCLSQWVNSRDWGGGEGGGKTVTNTSKLYSKLLNHTTKTFQGPSCWNTLVEWWSVHWASKITWMLLTTNTSYSLLSRLLYRIKQHLKYIHRQRLFLKYLLLAQ